MYTSYEKIYENLLPKFRSYDIPIMTTDEVKDYLHDFLAPAIARFHVCKKDLNDRDDLLERFNFELTDMEVEILSNYCLVCYIDSEYLVTPTILKATLSSSDFNAFSNANLLDKITALRNKYTHENEGLLMKYSWLSGDSASKVLNFNYNPKSSDE